MNIYHLELVDETDLLIGLKVPEISTHPLNFELGTHYASLFHIGRWMGFFFFIAEHDIIVKETKITCTL